MMRIQKVIFCFSLVCLAHSSEASYINSDSQEEGSDARYQQTRRQHSSSGIGAWEAAANGLLGQSQQTGRQRLNNKEVKRTPPPSGKGAWEAAANGWAGQLNEQPKESSQTYVGPLDYWY